MIYRKFKDLDISMLGFGLMRLPVKENGRIDEELTAEMVDYAMKHGVNYFDTAVPYHNGTSEKVIGKILKNYPRESFYLADKFPGHVISDRYDPEEIFEKQLKKCQVDYFDFYLLHNVYENSFKTYEDPQWGIVDYLIKQRDLGRIKHLGFSSHADLPTLRKILEEFGSEMEFCQIQYNYLDWTAQKGYEKYDLINSYGLPMIVMEPVKGGKLASLPEDIMAQLGEIRQGASAASYALRWTQKLDKAVTILSGMTDMAQTVDNVATFDHEDRLTDEEEKIIMEAAEGMKNDIPCTACRYCTDSCPMELDIPDLLFKYNQIRAGSNFTISMQLDSYPEDKLPSACIGCGACMEMCPQKIAIPDELANFTELLATVPKWADICKEREEAEKRMEEE